MQGNILLGNRPNFFVEHMTKSQNQPYHFKSGKKYISMGKITENVKTIEFKCQILEKWHHRGSLLAKNTKAGRLFCSNFLKQSATKIKTAAKLFSVPGDGGPLKKDMTFSSMLNYIKIFCF